MDSDPEARREPMVDTSLSFLDRLRSDDDGEAWRRLVAAYRPLLLTWLRAQRDLSEADREDLLQDVLLAVSQELPKFQHNGRTGAFRCWLRRLVAHRVGQHWRRRRRQPEAVGGSDFLRRLAELEDDASTPSRLWDRAHDLHVMHHLLETMRPRFDPRTWQAFRLQVMERLPAEEVAQRLDLTPNSVYVAKSRILNALRRAGAGLLD